MHSDHLGLRERGGETVECFVAGRAARDQLRDHRVVGDPDLVALGDGALDADRRRQPQPFHAPGLREERARILGVQAHLDRGSVQLHLEVDRLATRDPQLPLHEVDARHRFGDRVLHLDASVQLEEEELATLEHELGGAGTDVPDRGCKPHRRVAHPRAELGVERRRRRLLEHLLVAPLHRALALAEREHPSMRVGEQLDLDVPRALEVALEVDAVVAEAGLRLALRRLERRSELLGGANDAHAAAAAARGRLDDQRRRVCLRHGRHAGRCGDPLRFELVAATTECVGRRADPRQSGSLDGFGEVGVLGEEAVARVHGIGAALQRRPDVLLGVEVGADLDRLVGGAGVQ